MGDHFSTILDRALSRLEAGESVGTILADYPDQSDELALLLAVAKELSLMRDVPPAANFEAGLEAFLGAARAPGPDVVSPRHRWYWLSAWLENVRELWWYPRTRLVAGAVTALVLLFVLMGGAITLAADSLPGDWLYPVKLASEDIRLALTFDETARVDYQIAQVRTRAQEIYCLVQAGRPVSEATTARLNQSLQAALLASASADPAEIPRLLAAIEETTAEQAALLGAVEAITTSASAGQALVQACESLGQANFVARAGRTDLHAFRLNASLGAFQIGKPASAPLSIDLPTPTATLETLFPSITATHAPLTTARPTSTSTPTAAIQPSPTMAMTRTYRPTHTPSPTHTRPPSRTPQLDQTASPDPTTILGPTETSCPSPAPTVTETPKPTEKPSPTDKPESTDTPQPPGLTDTPQPPGQTKTPEPPGQIKTPKPTKTPKK